MRQRFKFDASVFVVVRNGDKILYLRRSGTGWLDGYWSLPAGAHDGHDSFVGSALRELNEETGLAAGPAACCLLHVQQVFMSPNSEWLALYFGVEAYEGTPEITEPDKHDRLEWREKFGEDELVVPYVRDALRSIDQGCNFSVYRD